MKVKYEPELYLRKITRIRSLMSRLVEENSFIPVKVLNIKHPQASRVLTRTERRRSRFMNSEPNRVKLI